MVLALVLPLPILYEIVMDQLQQPPIWVFEISGYAIIMIGFCASGYGLNTGHHFRLRILAQMHPRLESPLARLSGCFELIFGMILLASGWNQAHAAFAQNLLSNTLLQVPQFWPELALPVGGIAIATQGLAHILAPRVLGQ
ncbi:MAG TPA: TRAP transporter small permease [Acidiphilium sp.]|nr:TRAP transporter small permease [Acidiphilium sp.]HQU25225.1 TRAP transporter small permease [Acidiphilium sp.]